MSAITPVTKSVTDSWIFTHRSLIGIICLAPAGLAAIFSRPWRIEPQPGALLLGALGWIFFLAYLAIRIWGTLYLGGRKDRELQTSGPYSITRNPLYFGGMCYALSLAFFLQSFTLVLVTLLAAAAYSHWVVPAEEKVLESIFGDAYRSYKKRTPRLLPRFSLYSAGPKVEVRLAALRTEAKRLLTASCLTISIFFLLHFRAAGWWPHWFMLP
jgi:protein-S-isoprenylcysteine O-methyltransferase Ste14